MRTYVALRLGDLCCDVRRSLCDPGIVQAAQEAKTERGVAVHASLTGHSGGKALRVCCELRSPTSGNQSSTNASRFRVPLQAIRNDAEKAFFCTVLDFSLPSGYFALTFPSRDLARMAIRRNACNNAPKLIDVSHFRVPFA